jgi:lipopolysaccharide/colanic/teichoic acid biosynthesis glycosyltransferase
MPKQNALQKIESHEKLCRIMQKLTHKKIHSIEERVKRLEKILLSCTGALIIGMAYLIYTLITHLAL